MKTDRLSNFELLRIISMCGIIAIHYLAGHLGGMAENATFPNFEWFLSQFISSVACPLVNCFVLISGYFLVRKKVFGIRKVVDLLLITAFYGVIGYGIGAFMGVIPITVKGLLYAFFPFFEGKRWFVETYIILILLCPFINRIINGIDKKSFQILLTIQIFLFSLWYSVGLSSPILDDGYGIINFITLYLLGAYYRLYGSETFLWKLNKKKLFAGYILCSIMTFVLSYFIYPFGYSFITNIVGAVFLFLFFAKVQIGCNKKVNVISEAAFDVYFVHSDAYTSRLLIYELLQGKLFIGSVWIIPHLLISIIILYLFGMIMFKMRSFIFSKSIDKLVDNFSWLNSTRTI